jgi:hypothetical protein
MVAKKSTKRAVASPAAPTRRRRASSESHSAVAPKSAITSAVQVLREERTRSELATAAVVGLAAIIVEIELLPGILLGVAAMMLPKLFPGLPELGRPLIKSTIGLGYKAMAQAQQLVAEASDRAQDMLAEIKADTARAADAKGRPKAEI